MAFLYIFLSFLRERYDRNVSDGVSGRSMISIIYLMAALNFTIYLFAIFSDCQTMAICDPHPVRLQTGRIGEISIILISKINKLSYCVK